MHKGFIKSALFFGALSVALGAFGAHALKQKISAEAINTFETGVRYQFYHVFALLTAGILYKDFKNKFVISSGYFFIAGILLFSVSLYFLTFFKGFSNNGYNWIGAITPFGGLCFILGWIFLLMGLRKYQRT